MASLGEAIGLQATVDKDWMRLLMQNRQLAAQQEAGRAKAQEEEDDEFNKQISGVEVTGVHRLLQDDANKDSQETLKKVFDLKSKNPHNYRYEVQKEIMGLEGRQKDRLNKTKNYNQAQDFFKVNAEKGGATNEFTDAFQKAITGGKYEDAVKAAQGDYFGIININPEDGTFQMNPLPRIDTDKAITSQIKDPNLFLQRKQYADTYLPSGQIRSDFASIIPRTNMEAQKEAEKFGFPTPLPSIETITDNMLTNIPFVERKGVDYANAGMLTYEGKPVDVRTFRSMPSQLKQEIIRGPLFNDISGRSGAKLSTQTSAKPNQTFGLSADQARKDIGNDVEVADDETLTTTFNFPGVLGGGSVDVKATAKNPYKIEDVSTFKPFNTNMVLPEGTVDGKTGQRIPKGNVEKNVNIGGVGNVAFDSKTGARLNQGDIEAYKKQGRVVYKTVVPAYVTEKVRLTDDNGNVKEVNQTETYFIPAQESQGVLLQNKVDISEKLKVADQKNAALKTKTAIAPSQKKSEAKTETKDWSKYKRK